MCCTLFDPKKIKAQFPVFSHRPDWSYLDNAATTQKPGVVIKGITDFYEKQNTSIHRGVYPLASANSERYQQVRKKVAAHLGASSADAVVFTGGTTASINLVAWSFLEPRLKPGDNVVISAMEHHANLIPWQMLCKKKNAELRVIPVNKKGVLDIEAFKQLCSEKTKMVAIVHISNVLGTANPVEAIIGLAHRKRVPVLIDGAQSAAWKPLNVKTSDCDFYVFSGHKVFGPTGIGILYAREAYLRQMKPVNFGGDMIREVSFEETVFADPPRCFEAGTPHIAGVIGLGYALDFIEAQDKRGALQHLQVLENYTKERLLSLEGIRIVGAAEQNNSICSFVLEGIHPHDVATFLGEADIAVRAGHHCAQPLMDFLGLPGTVRVSFSIYNSKEEVDRMTEVLKDVQKFFT